MSKINLPTICQDVYLDYRNNFLTIECMAAYYGISDAFAAAMLVEGKNIHAKRVELLKAKGKRNEAQEERT